VIYSGTMIKDLRATVERVREAEAWLLPADNLDAAIYLGQVLAHIADRIMTSDDTETWWEVREIQNSLWSQNEKMLHEGLDQWLQRVAL
jgi:hypothetical protein